MVLEDISNSLKKTTDLLFECAHELSPLKRLLAGEAVLKETEKTIKLLDTAIELDDFSYIRDELIKHRDGINCERSKIQNTVKLDRDLMAMILSYET